MIFVHIGLRKAGSASIQAFLAANAEPLAQLGLLYPRTGRFERDAHHNLASELRSRRRFTAGRGGIDDVLAEWRASGAPNLILSSEMFEDCSAAQAGRLIGRLREADGDIRVILILRDLAHLIVSSYGQKVKYGRNSHDFDEFFETRLTDERVDYAETAERWAAAVGWDRLHVRLLEPALLANGDLIDELLALTGFDPASPAVRALDRPGVLNVTPGWRVLEAIRALYSGERSFAAPHPLAEASDHDRVLRKRVGRAAGEVGEAMGWNVDRGLYLTRAQAKRCFFIHRRSMKRLNGKLAAPLPYAREWEPGGSPFRSAEAPSADQIDPRALASFYERLADAAAATIQRATDARHNARARAEGAGRGGSARAAAEQEAWIPPHARGEGVAEIIVHAGLRQSGGEAVRGFLAENDAALESLGLLYPRAGRWGLLRADGHVNLARELRRPQRFDPAFGALAQAAEEWRRSAATRLLLSCDLFEEFEPHHIRLLYQRLSRGGESMRAVILVSDPIEAIYSGYVQKVAFGQQLLDFDNYFDHRQQTGKIDVSAIIRRWVEALGRDQVEVVSREEAPDGEPVDAVLRRLGLDRAAGLAGLPRPSVGRRLTPGWRVLEAIRALYDERHGLGPRHPLADAVEQDAAARLRLSRAALRVGADRGWNERAGAEEYLTREQARACLLAQAIAMEGSGSGAPAQTIAARSNGGPNVDYRHGPAPSAEQIAPDELRAFYRALAGSLARAGRSAANRRAIRNPARPAAPPRHNDPVSPDRRH